MRLRCSIRYDETSVVGVLRPSMYRVEKNSAPPATAIAIPKPITSGVNVVGSYVISNV
jgi:hypothetical protein